ncbi:hypothetical protein JTB14_025854 [Gonioctena quinquepunctata]|nr:hypothetical protein JTB14_025854 [Gonioctena quinquepunctata]
MKYNFVCKIIVNKYPTDLRGHKLEKYSGLQYKRRRCVGCYFQLSQLWGPTEASRKTKQVSTYCSNCVRQPHLCTVCFKNRHGDSTTEMENPVPDKEKQYMALKFTNFNSCDVLSYRQEK